MDLWMVVAHCSLRVGDGGAGEEEQMWLCLLGLGVGKIDGVRVDITSYTLSMRIVLVTAF